MKKKTKCKKQRWSNIGQQEFRTVIFEKRETNDVSALITSADFLETFQAVAEGAGRQTDSSTLLGVRSQSWEPGRPEQLKITGQGTTEKRPTSQRELQRCADGTPRVFR